MAESVYVTVKEVSELLGVAESTAYKIMRQLNHELESNNYITIAGRVSRKYLMERVYGMKIAN
ncbi:MAG: transcriptional regulator [Lachnospiraceae bacterium]